MIIHTYIKRCLFTYSKISVQRLMCCLLAFFVITSCYNPRDEREIKNKSYLYKQNDNFIVVADSVNLVRIYPENLLEGILNETITLKEKDVIVVVKNDSAQSNKKENWVLVAKNEYDIGWIKESVLLKNVVKKDPISQFIETFSSSHLIIFICIITFSSLFLWLKKVYSKHLFIVHFNDINSFYPTFLALLMSYSAALYGTIQNYAADEWQYFYFHPTLNPFTQKPLLMSFIILVWLLLIVGIATIDEIFKKLSPQNAVYYTFGLVAICAANYIIFSVLTIYIIGYILLILYTFFAIRLYIKKQHTTILCGICNKEIAKKGACPHCGAINK